MVEGAAIPSPGTPLHLMRGRLNVAGRVVWTCHTKAGVEFNASVCVREWLAQPSNREQERVDQIVSVIKSGAIPFTKGVGGTADQSQPTSSRISEDLEHLRRMIDDLGEELSEDPDTLARFSVKLQNLDNISQTLSALAEVLAGGASSERAARLDDLRRSCQQALS